MLATLRYQQYGLKRTTSSRRCARCRTGDGTGDGTGVGVGVARRGGTGAAGWNLRGVIRGTVRALEMRELRGVKTIEMSVSAARLAGTLIVTETEPSTLVSASASACSRSRIGERGGVRGAEQYHTKHTVQQDLFESLTCTAWLRHLLLSSVRIAEFDHEVVALRLGVGIEYVRLLILVKFAVKRNHISQHMPLHGPSSWKHE